MLTNCRERTPDDLGSQTKTVDIMTGSQTTGIHATGIMHPAEVTSVRTVGRGMENPGPAYGKSCRGCGKQNHFEAVCRSKNPNKTNELNNRKRDVQNLVDEHSSSDESDDIAYTFSVNSAGKTKSQPMFQIIIHDTPLTIMADSGASGNVLDEKDYRALTKPPALQQTKVKIPRSPWKIHHCFKVQVDIHQRKNLCSPRIRWFVAQLENFPGSRTFESSAPCPRR